MKKNRLTITINNLLHTVYLFCITPPNSTKWIPGIAGEETNEWPIKIGTVYKLTNQKGDISNVSVTNIIHNEIVEWVSEDRNYHCRYTFKSLTPTISELQYDEWVDRGEIEEPFTIDILQKLKEVLET